MQNKYYYLVASLPFLRFGEAPPLPKRRFLTECEKWLTAKDLETLYLADFTREQTPGGEGVLKEWKKFDLELKQKLADVRKARQTGETYKTPELLKDVMEQKTPLLMEEEIAKIRWDFLEEKSARYFFDTNAVILYFLRMQIMERLARFNKDEGEKIFYKLCGVEYEQKDR